MKYFVLYFSRIFHIFHVLDECFNNSIYLTILYTLFHSTSLQMSFIDPSHSSESLALDQ